MIEQLSRRKLLGGLGLLIAAPAVIRFAQLMPIKAARAPLILQIQFDGVHWIDLMRIVQDRFVDEFQASLNRKMMEGAGLDAPLGIMGGDHVAIAS